MPLANAFRDSPADFRDEAKFPLALSSCRACGLVQLTFVVPAPVLYRDYIYVSSTSEAVGVHVRALANRLVERYGLLPTDLVVEIASNDGTALKEFQDRGLNVLGVEPARNIAKLAERAGVPTIPEFFKADLAATVAAQHRRAAVVLARHVLAHVDDVHDFLEGVCRLMEDEGVFVIEVPYLADLMANRAFDTIYHEHLSYFALSQIVRLCEDHGLRVIDVERITLHGGSIVVYIGKPWRNACESVQRLLEEEAARKLSSEQNLTYFTREVAVWKQEFESVIDGIIREGGVVVGYGAAAKANTLLNHCPSVARSLACILDRSPHKHGRFTPGTHRPVRPVAGWQSCGATHLLILAWNFKEEIMRQMQPFADNGGQFVIPLPVPAIL